MKHNGVSCTVESAPCHCLLDGSRSTSNRSQISTHDPTWASNSSAVSVSASAGPRNRANGAVSAWCSSPECMASWAEVTERQVQGALSKVLVTGGAGYFGFRLGRTLASQGVKVVLLDLFKPPWDIPEGAVFYQVVYGSVMFDLEWRRVLMMAMQLLCSLISQDTVYLTSISYQSSCGLCKACVTDISEIWLYGILVRRFQRFGVFKPKKSSCINCWSNSAEAIAL